MKIWIDEGAPAWAKASPAAIHINGKNPKIRCTDLKKICIFDAAKVNTTLENPQTCLRIPVCALRSMWHMHCLWKKS